MRDDFVRFCKADIETSIPEVFERQVRAGPERIAVASGQQSLSYDDLNRRSNRIAHAIMRALDHTQEPVALLFRQGAAAVAATLGTLKAGKIYVALEPTQSDRELGQVIADCKPRLIVTDTEHQGLAKRLNGAGGLCLEIDAMSAGQADDDPNLGLAPDRVCYIFYTSGTTGPPKGVYDSHRNVLHNVMRYTNTLGIGASDRLSLIESCSYSGTVSSLFSALLNGAAICPFDLQAKGVERMAAWVDDEAITIFHAVPTIFEQLLSRRGRLDSVRMVRLEGDRAEPRHITLFQDHFDRDRVLVNGLGLTEAGIVRQLFVTPDDAMEGPVVPVGQAVEDMDIVLFDDDGRAVGPEAVGEIVVRSAYLACGYWGRPDLTDAKFSADPSVGARRQYRTGDLGRMRADGLLDFLGRKDFRAKLRGQWIETADIEKALCAIAGIDRALVMVRDDGLGTQQLVAYLVTDGALPSVDSVRLILSRSLSAIMVPSRYVFTDTFPEDRNGKVEGRALPVPGQERPPMARDFVAPRNSEEEVVAECFCQVLRLDRVGVEDDFLDLGGDSLLATELLQVLGKRFGEIWSAGLISRRFSVASLIEGHRQGPPESVIVELQVGDGRAPLFCIHNYRGYVLGYTRLVHALGPDQPVYGVQSRAFTKVARMDTSIETMASAYVQEITAMQGAGPYHLCGNCFGGLVAYEMAHQLRQQGHEVGLLALIDTRYPLGVLGRMVASASRAGTLRRISGRISRRVQGATPSEVQADPLGVHERNRLAMNSYRPRRFDGAMALICPGPLTDQQGWIRMAMGGCEVVEVPLTTPPYARPHLTEAPYVNALAEHITRLLAKR